MRGSVMDILEELWYGNITPTEYSCIEKLLIANEEFANLIEPDYFKVGFKLGARLTIETCT